MSLNKKLIAFTKKSDSNKLIAGIIVLLLVLLPAILILSVLEYTFWFDSTTRTVLFVVLAILSIGLIIGSIVLPLLSYLGIRTRWTQEKAAQTISQKIPELNDELINYLQLEKNENELARASVQQKSQKLANANFLKAIDTRRNRKYARYLAIIVVLFISVAFINPPMVTDGTERIFQFRKEFVQPAPFSFTIKNDSLKAFRDQDFELLVDLQGENIPENSEIVIGSSRFDLNKTVTGELKYTFRSIARDQKFYLEAAGFQSRVYELQIMDKPALNLMKIALDYPSYTRLKDDTLHNSGNLQIPEGTTAHWALQTSHARKAHFYLPKDTLDATRLNDSDFRASQQLMQSGRYDILLKNQYGENESQLTYNIDVVKDEVPEISADFVADSSLYSYVFITGTIQDDYGFRSLTLNYELNGKKYQQAVDINLNSNDQQFMAQWSPDSVQLQPEDELQLYLVVRDNDQVNGYKAAQSQVYTFRKPGLNEVSDLISKKSDNAEGQLEESLKETEELQESLKKLSDRLKSKNEMNWQEEKLAKQAIEKRKALEEMLKELSEKHKELMKARKNFKQSKALEKKSEEFNRSIEKLMDEETRKLYEELQKLLQENANTEEVQKKLNQISRQENRLKKDLERTKELFKRMQIEAGLEQTRQQLDSLASKQDQLSRQPKDSSGMQEQEKLKEDFSEVAEELEKIQELNQELKRPEPLEDFEPEQKAIDQEMQKALENMKAGEKSKSKKNQENAAEQMRQMSKKMQNMQAGMEMEVMQENIENLRKILDDLVRLSYEQESLLNNFRSVDSSDPRFIELSQDQLKLKEDLVVIEDSLMALAERVVSLSSFITKEVDDINYQMDESIKHIRERHRGKALSHQQFSMTAMNNLALLLNDVLQNMQMTMSEAMGNRKGGKPKEMPLPSLGEMQKQLGDQIKKLNKQGHKNGQLSKELARLAAEQEMIRQQLQKMQEQMEGQPGGKQGSDELKKAIEMMEDNEIDLVNKRITEELMRRQEKINTRMLKAEEAKREQELDPERESETASQKERTFPPEFEKYLEERRKEIERLRTVPIELKPFYKKEVNDYFRRLSEKSQ